MPSSLINRFAAAALMSFWLPQAASYAEVAIDFSTSYRSSEGYVAGSPTAHPDWTGSSNMQVTPTGVGTLANQLSGVDPIFGTTGALDAFPNHKFGVGDRIEIRAQLRFDLSGSLSTQEIARFGFSRDASSGVIEQGFGVAWDEGFSQPSEQRGHIRFFPDFNDFILADGAAPRNVNNSFQIQGRFAGLGANDRESNPFDITYAARHTGGDLWNVETLSITDQFTNATFFYDFSFQQPQTFQFDGQNAVLGQDLVVQGRSSNAVTATSDFISFSYQGTPVSAVPEPALPGLILAITGALYLQRRPGRR
ncbi:hypothetical protein NZK35_08795 [Stieleria sp. ICT_E10.1]|uniref:hypothetical protein n=1 Tax=Stieleria sedimenti TaxID=2976331 RepID=UPI00217FB96B|nr:hypothetical protein [Stieleria sedimenti]MCS7466738.1 hypothetical protein [Stieleria sedimenti]